MIKTLTQAMRAFKARDYAQSIVQLLGTALTKREPQNQTLNG